ncbi:MAG: pilus assembly protein TadG-related protein [Gemmobacter sp.]|nr:pilus assembly protein TadG-related protein [Gemmobacter sp.]
MSSSKNCSVLAKFRTHRVQHGKLSCRFARFRGAEDGGILIFALVVLMLMLFTGGMAVDVMRYEAERSRITDTADRAALAGASMRQEIEPSVVVQDYFDRADLSANLSSVTVDEGMNYRNVAVTTNIAVDTYFMRLMRDTLRPQPSGTGKIERLSSNGISAAEERRTNVEISMVLDISGSMVASGTSRMENLRVAADEFIEKVLEDDTENRVSISLVPYNGQIMLPTQLMAKYNVDSANSPASNMNCLDLNPSSYGTIPISRTATLLQSTWADSFSPTYTNSHLDNPATPANSYVAAQSPNSGNIWCNSRTANRMRLFSNNASGLRGDVQNYEAIGATSIDAGLKWGAMLLDPASRPMIAELASQGVVPAHFANRPLEYNDPEVLKVIILLTDGDHFDEERMNNPYRKGLSPIWRSYDTSVNPRVWRYSIHHPTGNGSSSNKYWVPHRNSGGGEWRSAAFNTGNGVTQMDWEDVWQEVRVQWVAWQLYARALNNSSNSNRLAGYKSALAAIRTRTDASVMDARLQTLCNAVKGQRVVIFGIAFEAPTNGTNAIRSCATEDKFFEVYGPEVRTAFRMIRSQISQLRLTQ